MLALACVVLGGGAPTAYGVLEGEQPRPAAAAQQQPGEPHTETRLFFGTVRPDGGPAVTDEQFRAFLTEVVTPRFPDGLNVQEGYGQYRDAHGTIEREHAYELVLYYPVGDSGAAAAKIEEIRRAYVERFAQESVARVDDRTRVDF